MKSVLLAIAAVVVVAGICVGGWFLYWGLAHANQQQQYSVNTDGQQYQAALVSQERDRAAAYAVAADGPQKLQIKSTFCAVFPTLKPAPADLIQANSQICF